MPAKPEVDSYRIIDRNGIFYNLQYSDNILSKGQIVKCRFVKLTPKYFQFELVAKWPSSPIQSRDNIRRNRNTSAAATVHNGASY